MFVPPTPPIIYVGILTPKVMALGNRAFGKCLGHEGRALTNGIRALTNAALRRYKGMLTSVTWLK